MPFNPNDPRISAYQSDPFLMGVDLRRSIIKTDPGAYVADPAASWRAGQVVAQNAAGNIILCDGLGAAPSNVPFGIAKFDKTNSKYAAKIDEAVVLTGVVASNLKRGSIFGGPAGGVRVASAPGMSGTTYVEGVDYTVNYTNGQVVRTGGSTIPSGSTVYVTYQFLLLEQDYDFQGRNFFNFLDDVTIQDGRITIIQDWALLFLTMYDPSVTWAIGQPVYVDTAAKAGLLTNVAGGRPLIGSVRQLPTAEDPFLGVAARI